MKKIRVTTTQTLELPDDTELVNGPDGILIKVGDNYLMPSIEYMQTKEFSEIEMEFHELDENLFDVIFSSVASEISDVTEE